MEAFQHSGYKDFVWAIQLNRFGFQLLGLWPDSDEEDKSDSASDLRAGIIFIITVSMLLVPLICSLVREWGDLIFIVGNLQITLPLLSALLKITIMRWKRAALSFIIRMMAEDWTEVKPNAERNVMIRRGRVGRLIMIVAYTLVGCGTFVVIFLPICGLPFIQMKNLTNRNILPLQIYYFYDTNKSPQFEFTFFIQTTSVFLAAIAYMTVDSFLGLSILHICGQLENFRHRLSNLTLHKDFDAALRNNVRTHLRLIRFANIVDNIYAIMMLGLIFYFAVAFCLYGFLLASVLTDDTLSNVTITQKFHGILGIVIIFMQTFLYCIAGEMIADECQTVYNAICNIEWYKLDTRNARTLILLMLRASKYFRINAGSIMFLTMTSFCSLLKTSAGYISFLLAKHG